MSVRLGEAPFDPGAETNAFLAASAGAGAVVTFTGIVRSRPDDPVATLTLECYPELAEAQIGKAIAEAVVRFGLIRARVIHRHGRLVPGDPIVQVMTLAPHREAAFHGAEFLMDYLKTDAPFWKQETTSTGDRWVQARPEDDAARNRWRRPADSPAIGDTDRKHLIRAVDLAEAGLALDNDPFGSVLVSATGEVLFEDHNRTAGGDQTRHPEFEIARWAAAHLTPEERARATVYTSGEHCPMCAAAHGWVGLGRIVYAASSAQFSQWLTEFGAGQPPVKPLPIGAIINAAQVEGPEPSLTDRLRALHRRRFETGGYGNSRATTA